MIADPAITIYSCSFCGAVPGELAALQGLEYPANVHVVSLPCISRVQSDVILSAFEAGADGVLLVACEEGNCHYQGGNERAFSRFTAMRDLLEQVGIGAERLTLWQGGLGQASQFTEHIRQFVEEVRGLGASPLKRGGNLD